MLTCVTDSVGTCGCVYVWDGGGGRWAWGARGIIWQNSQLRSFGLGEIQVTSQWQAPFVL